MKTKILLSILVAVISLFSFAAKDKVNKCKKCGKVAPTGWTFCQKCKTAAEKAERERVREEKAKKAEVEKELSVPLEGLFGVKLSRPSAEVPGIEGKGKKSDDKSVVYNFKPEKNFRGFTRYRVFVNSAREVIKIIADREMVQPDVNSEFNECASLLEMKFDRKMEQTGNSPWHKSRELKFGVTDGVVGQRIVIVQSVKKEQHEDPSAKWRLQIIVEDCPKVAADVEERKNRDIDAL